MNLLIKHYIHCIVEKISEVKGEKIDESLESILQNLKYLAQRSTSTPEPYYWIPIEIKRMLLFIIYEGKAVIETTITDIREGKYAEAVSRIIVDDIVISSCEKRISYEDIDPFAGHSPDKRNILMREQAKGSAETRALYRAGIAMEFTGDIIEKLPETTNQKIPEGVSDENTQNPPIEQPYDETVAERLKDILQETFSSPVSQENIPIEEQEVLFGNSKGQKLSDMSLDYLSYMLAFIEAGLETVPKEYQSYLQEKIWTNEEIAPRYNYWKKYAEKLKNK